jgi:hydroxymethylglutaryl-CoA reductase (NADPH)
MSEQNFAPIPLKWVGPIKIRSTEISTEIEVPLATFEKPIWNTVNRGALISRLTNGIDVTIVQEQMTRSILMEAENAKAAVSIVETLKNCFAEIAKVVANTSKFVTLTDLNFRIVGKLIYIRIAGETGDAAGHNMMTKAAEAVILWLQKNLPNLKYISLSGNYCVDKKVSAINSILGRGKNAIAEIVISRDVCLKHLRSTPEQIVDLNIKKNLLGSIVAGSLQSANAHFANMLLAFYLATGQDGANIVEGSQGITFAEIKNSDLYFSVTLPNIIVGTVGSGKDLNFVQENLRRLNCLNENEIGLNARKIAIIVAAVVLCGELSLLAALTNQDELMRAHNLLERH